MGIARGPTHIPYMGGSPAMVGILRGEVDVYFSSISGARSFIESNQVRALAVKYPGKRWLAGISERISAAGVCQEMPLLGSISGKIEIGIRANRKL
jgi:hypothetical protein